MGPRGISICDFEKWGKQWMIEEDQWREKKRTIRPKHILELQILINE